MKYLVIFQDFDSDFERAEHEYIEATDVEDLARKIMIDKLGFEETDFDDTVSVLYDSNMDYFEECNGGYDQTLIDFIFDDHCKLIFKGGDCK